MKPFSWFRILSVALPLALVGCVGGTPSRGPSDSPTRAETTGVDEEAKVKANLGKLSPEDRAIAEAQKFCPITEGRLGSPEMGPPVKIMVKDQPVFLCCKHCEKKALADPDETLAKVKELKEKAAKPDK